MVLPEEIRMDACLSTFRHWLAKLDLDLGLELALKMHALCRILDCYRYRAMLRYCQERVVRKRGALPLFAIFLTTGVAPFTVFLISVGPHMA